MRKRKIAIGLLVAAAMVASLRPAQAGADGSDEMRPIRLYATARVGPIGHIMASSFTATAFVDGRAASSEQVLWGGELVQAPRDRSVRVSFDGVGEALLSRGAAARFSTSISGADAGRSVLVTRLIAGRLSVRLDNDAGAYVEAAGSGYTATRGASFSVLVNEDGRALIEEASGALTTAGQTTPQGRFTLRPPSGQGGSLSVAARSTRQIQIQVTDENDRPVPDLPILFSLADPCLGSLGAGAVAAATTLSSKTDNRGIATVPWIVGATRCAGTILARVEGTNFTYTYRVQVQPQGFWTTQNTLLVAAAAAGAGTGIYLGTRNNDEPLRPVPPPQVRP